jgi:hypothetical protein
MVPDSRTGRFPEMRENENGVPLAPNAALGNISRLLRQPFVPIGVLPVVHPWRSTMKPLIALAAFAVLLGACSYSETRTEKPQSNSVVVSDSAPAPAASTTTKVGVGF